MPDGPGTAPGAGAPSSSVALPAPAPAAPARAVTPLEMEQFRAAVEKGVAHLNAGRYSEAAGELSVAAAIQPQNAHVLRFLGNAYARDNNLERAARALQASISVDDTIPATHYELAQVGLAAGDLELASRESLRTTQLDPTNGKALELLGLVQYRQGDLDAALATLEPVAHQGGSRQETGNILGLCYQGLERYEEARTAFQQVVESYPGYTEAWFNLGKVLAILGDEEGAGAANERFLSLGGETPAPEPQSDENAPPGVGGP